MSRALLPLAAGAVVAFLALPIAALVAETPLRRLPELLRDPVVVDAVVVTARTNLIANAVILALGTPAAFLLATRRFRGRTLVLTLTELPLVLPPAVAGIGLLAAFGGSGIPFTEWAVVMAIVFVASPFYLRAAVAAFDGVDRTLVGTARTLGASPARTFLRVWLPLAAGPLAAGWVLAFARGIGEFGATIVFAGNVRGETSTLTLAVYEQLDASFDVALALGLLLVALSAVILLSAKLLGQWRASSWRSASPAGASASS